MMGYLKGRGMKTELAVDVQTVLDNETRGGKRG